jgi:hypothetical protein
VRQLPPGGFAGDDGSADPALAAALSRRQDGVASLADVVAALSCVRLLVPVVAVLGEAEVSAGDGLASDKSADMALVTLTAPDGRRALPVFTSTAALSAWDATARPVPVEARGAALSAVDEGCELMVLDPGTASVLVPRPAVWALAKGEPWVPSPLRADVDQALRRAVAGVPAVVAVHGEPGRTAELAVVLAVRAGLDRDALADVTARVSEALAAEQVVADRVDSVELRVVPARPSSLLAFAVYQICRMIRQAAGHGTGGIERFFDSVTRPPSTAVEADMKQRSM